MNEVDVFDLIFPEDEWDKLEAQLTYQEAVDYLTQLRPTIAHDVLQPRYWRWVRDQPEYKKAGYPIVDVEAAISLIERYYNEV